MGVDKGDVDKIVEEEGQSPGGAIGQESQSGAPEYK
jgi:hypothetical protein